MRGLIISLPLASTVALSASRDASARADDNLTVVIKLVQAPDPQASVGLGEWSQAFRTHLDVVSYETMRRYFRNRTLRVWSSAIVDTPTAPQMAAWWREQEAIYVVSATATAPTSARTVIQSTVYMGNFKGHLTSPMFTLRQEIRAADYRSSQKTLEAITFYGLGNQALAGGNGRVACALYRRSRQALDDVATLATGAHTLAEALAHSRSDIRC